ncbi:MAG: hypothetical protein WB607_25640 [Candidatus Acidiferrum sp.]|jgi:hypothetical protein
MRLAALFLLCLLPCAAQEETNQTMLTGSDVPDSAAWRIWLDSKAEAPPHSAQFTSWIKCFGGLPEDRAVIQTILEQYYEADSAAHLAYLAEADSYAQAGDAASVARLQEAYINRKAILVANTIESLKTQLSGAGAEILTGRLPGWKGRIYLSPNDPAVIAKNRKKGIIPASFHDRAMVRGEGGIGFQYSVFSDIWFATGFKENGEQYGTVYFQEGVDGTTNPCSGSCLTATHTVITNYDHTVITKDHTGSEGNKQESLCAGRPYDVMGIGCSHVYSHYWGDGYFWSDKATVKIHSSIAGDFFEKDLTPHPPE